MSHYDYEISGEIASQRQPFNALIMAAMRNADTGHLAKLRAVFPEVYDELHARYHAPGGLLEGERP